MVKRTAAAACRTAVLLLLLAAALITGPACGQHSILPAEDGAGKRLVDRVPRGCATAGCVFLDAAGLRDHFQGIYGGYRDAFRLLGDYGIDFDDVDRLACAGLSLFLIEGRFDPDRVREELGARDYVRAAYLGAEVWEGTAAGVEDWVALLDGIAVAGCRDSVIDCLEVMVEGEDSLPVHPDVTGVLERLPPGLDMSVAALALDNPILAHGESLQRVDDDTLRLTVVRKYADPAAAEDGAGQLAPDMQDLLSQQLRDVRVQREDQFVTLQANVAPEAIAAGMAGV